MTYPIHPGPPSGQQKLGKNRQTLSLAEQLRSVQTSHWLFFNSSSSMDTMREPIWFMCLLCLFLLDQGIPVKYELDEFNTPHTGTALFHTQNCLCRLRCLIPLRHQATTSPLGNIFWKHSASPRNNQKHKLTMTPKFISSNDKHGFRYILRTYLPRTSNNTRCYLNSLITPFRLFTSFLSYEACSTNANSLFHAAN